MPVLAVASQHRGGQRQPGAAAPLRMSSQASAVSKNEDLLPGIEAINDSNGDLFSRLDKMRDNPYFRLYSVDILASCEYMPQELFECYTESCEIYPVDEDEVRSYATKLSYAVFSH